MKLSAPNHSLELAAKPASGYKSLIHRHQTIM